MKTKTMIAAALLTAGLGLGAVSTPANAASWHRGTPKVLRGKWDNNGAKDELWVSTRFIYVIPFGGASVAHVKAIKYRYVGHHTYKYRERFQPGGWFTNTIKVSANHHYARFEGLAGLFTKK
ncbi:hypothetical protein [Lentilactobacillus otakiensis]|uniref:hypothetical protein n=1 Tax=Lentilactobacillus otakiensis TaxID=481720 RepID=UPI003D172B00